MKNTLSMILLLCTGMAGAQTKSETINKEFSFEKKGPQNAILVANINGSVSVEGYAGNTVVVEVQKTITGKTSARLDLGMQEVQLGVIDRADSIILYVKGICPQFGRSDKNRHGDFGKWNYEWDNCEHEKGYDYKLDFKVKVPQGVNVAVSTINDGNIAVQKVSGEVHANNINGGIRLADLTTSAKAHTINGDVDIRYAENPKSDCRFYTLNGDINAYFKKGLSSEVSFKSFNGEFYTNLEKIEALPIMVEKNETGKGTKYKVNGNRYQTGTGGAHLDFETFNGNVYLKEQ